MGFSIIGFFIGFLIILPSILFALYFQPKHAPTEHIQISWFFLALEKIGQLGSLSILVISRDNFNIQFNHWTILMVLSMLVYYYLWGRYVIKGQDYTLLWAPLFYIPVPMAIFPVITLSFAALWGKSTWLMLSAFILAIGHIVVSWYTYKQSIA